jgi:putative phosphoribosyl transferase
VSGPFFKDRADAARQLIAALPPDIDRRWLVLGLPRGGVPIAADIARHLGGAFDILIVRKVGLPNNPELAVAAVTGPGPDQLAINRTLQDMLDLSELDIQALAVEPIREVEKRRRMWLEGRSPLPFIDRDVLIVDDGAATGTTLEAALTMVRRQGARAIAVAVPVALQGALDRLSMSGVRVICPHRSDRLYSISGAYRDFPQVTDQQVTDMLSCLRREQA